MTGEHFMSMCSNCGAYFPTGNIHVCGRSHFGPYAPREPGAPPGAVVAKALTEQDVRRIVREEIERAKGQR